MSLSPATSPLVTGRRVWAAVVVLALGGLALVVGSGMFRGQAPAEPVAPASVTATAASAAVYVHVSGAVRTPGLYRLDAGARLMDAVGAAGGFAEDADQAGVNLARPVTDGEQVQVPRIGEAPAAADAGTAAGGSAAGGGSTLVNLNTADSDQLDTLPRVGPAIAQRIIDWREQNGGFTSVEDLLAVPGIGEKMLAGLRELVTV